jgi:hypothetical protein
MAEAKKTAKSKKQDLEKKEVKEAEVIAEAVPVKEEKAEPKTTLTRARPTKMCAAQ